MESKIILAMRPVLAPKRSVNKATLLALGKAATNTTTTSVNRSMRKPCCMAADSTNKTKTGCRTNLKNTVGKTSRHKIGAWWVSLARICDRANTAPIVNSATGDAESANKATVFSMGSIRVKPKPEDAAPNKIAQGMGLVTTPFSALRAALLAPCSSAPSKRDKAMHKEEVTIKSTKMVTIAGPAAAAPKSATKRGTPIKPVLGNVPTNAPNAASFQPIRRLKLTATTKPTISKEHNK